MESNPRDYGEQCRFDAFCKKVLRNEARAYLRNMKRQREREAFFSDLSQAERNRIMTRFKAGEIDVLVATDVAARGIDVSDVDAVCLLYTSDAADE